MIDVRAIGHATFETPDVERQVDYYTQDIRHINRSDWRLIVGGWCSSIQDGMHRP